MTTSARISGMGAYLPQAILSNADLVAGSTDITDEWIVSRTGIETRRVLAPGETGADMAFAAATRALAAAGRGPEDITHILYATCTPDASCPSTACILADKLGITGRMAIDFNAACAGFINGLEMARALIALDPSAVILLAASESLSHRCNIEDPSTAVLFGDGSGVAIVTGPKAAPAGAASQPQGQVKDISIGSDGSKGGLLLMTGGFTLAPYKLGDTVGPEYFIRMDGGLVYKHAVRNMTRCCQELLKRNGMTTDDVDMFVPHQANLRIIEAVGQRLDISGDRVFLNVHKYGNTSAASIPIALTEALETGAIKPGARVLLTTFGAGLTWAAGLLQF